MVIKKTAKKATPSVVGKSELVERIGRHSSLTKAQIETVIDRALVEIKKSLLKGETIRFQKFISLQTAIQGTRTAMNLQTGKKITIPAKRVPKAKFMKELKEEISKSK